MSENVQNTESGIKGRNAENLTVEAIAGESVRFAAEYKVTNPSDPSGGAWYELYWNGKSRWETAKEARDAAVAYIEKYKRERYVSYFTEYRIVRESFMSEYVQIVED